MSTKIREPKSGKKQSAKTARRQNGKTMPQQNSTTDCTDRLRTRSMYEVLFAANQQGSGTQSSHLKTLLLQVLIITCNSTAWTQATSCAMTATGRIHCALSMDTRTTFPRISFARRGSTSRNVPRRPAVGRQDTNQLALDVRVALSTYCSGSRN